MPASERYALLSLGFGIAAFALVVFWAAECCTGDSGVFGIPAAWRQNVLLGTPLLFMVLGAAALVFGGKSNRLERAGKSLDVAADTLDGPPAPPRSDTPPMTIGAALGCMAVGAGLLLTLLVFVLLLALW